ncbi:MAG: hypothetical protein HKN09_11905 [Saprospiraceae bacterium]|nr:hypothetical protein [Saprospiraceae bacterium]
MRLIIKSICIILLSSAIFTSCNQDPCFTKDQFLGSFENLLTEVQQSEELTDNSKSSYEQRYEDIVNNCYKKYKGDLTLDEKQEFWKSSLKLYMTLYENNISELMDDADNDPFKQYVKAEIEEIIKDSGMSFMADVSEILEDELPKIIEELVGGLEKIGEDLLKLFEE